MPVTFTDDEQFLIEQLAKTPEELETLEQKDIDRIAQLLVDNMGNMKFNKKLSRSSDLARFIYKTQDYDSIESINRKVQINKNLKGEGLDIVEEEKLSLKEIGRLMKFSDFSVKTYATDFNIILEYINKHCNNKAFKELYTNVELSQSALSDIKQSIIESKNYQTNDIALDNMNKSHAVTNKNPGLLHYNGPLAQMLLSDGYGHAAPLYKNNFNNIPTQTKKSHMHGGINKIESIEVSDILCSDIFRIEPTKLINKSFIPQLKERYGEKEWEGFIIETYKKFSDSLHNSFEISNKQFQELNSLNANGYQQIQALNRQVRDLKNNNAPLEQISPLQEEINNLQALQNSRYKEIDNLKAKNFISLDNARLDNPLKWFSPKAIVQGHTKLGHKNDFRKISNEMFNPTENNKKMICSEFGAVTIAASIDQLNRIVSQDLQAKGLITSEQEIFKNPIPKNERINKIHPGRLVHLLKKAGAVEVRNETVDQYVKRNDLTSMETANIEKDLPNKILHLLKNSKDEQDFIDKANKNLEIYLEAYKVEQEVIEQIKKDSKTQFEDFYKRKNETGIITSIKKFCKGIAVSLHLRTKEKSTKKLSGNILTQVEKIKKQRLTQVEEIKKQRDYQARLNTIYNSITLPVKAETSVGMLEKKRKVDKDGGITL